MTTWKPNQTLDDGRFIIEKVLGGGGFGVTYSAKEISTGKLVAIKTLNPFQQSKDDFQKRQVKFVNEAVRLAKCSHPHIVQIYGVIQEEELWGMVMEYIDGEDLAVYLDEHGVLSEPEALRYIDQVGQALEYVHQQKLLHRDVKPSNIVLRRGTQEAVLINFGLAREYTLGKTGSMTNDKTHGYAPPEQYDRQGQFGEYTDVYALAATLYNLLTNQPVLPAIFRQTGIPLKPPQEFNSQISDRLNQVIIKGMELEINQRPQTVGEFRELLGLLGNQQQSKVQLVSPVGMDYTQLQKLLAAEKWKEADQETARVMLEVARRERWLRVEDIDNFPCEDLRTIDQLWVKYSNGRFGFSVQKRIYQNLGGTRDYNQTIWYAFGDVVGWRKGGNWLYYNDVAFHKKAPVAHLPIGGKEFAYVEGRENSYRMSRRGSLLSRRDL